MKNSTGSTRHAGRAAARALVFVLALGAAAASMAQSNQPPPPAIDLPPCETSSPGMSEGLAVGVAQPHAAGDVLSFAARLAAVDPALGVCSESWSAVLPRFVPWAGALERGYGFAAFALAFVLAVLLLRALTPRRWWQPMTALGLLAVAGLTWVLGIALLAGFHALGGQRWVYGTVVSLRAPQQPVPAWHAVSGAREMEALLAQRGIDTTVRAAPRAQAPAPAADPAVPAPAPAGVYRAFHRLALRTAPGVQAERVAVLPRGAEVAYDGASQGDWWRIKTADGKVGWASSLWLRRPEELPAVPRRDQAGTRPAAAPAVAPDAK